MGARLFLFGEITLYLDYLTVWLSDHQSTWCIKQLQKKTKTKTNKQKQKTLTCVAANSWHPVPNLTSKHGWDMKWNMNNRRKKSVGLQLVTGALHNLSLPHPAAAAPSYHWCTPSGPFLSQSTSSCGSHSGCRGSGVRHPSWNISANTVFQSVLKKKKKINIKTPNMFAGATRFNYRGGVKVYHSSLSLGVKGSRAFKKKSKCMLV